MFIFVIVAIILTICYIKLVNPVFYWKKKQVYHVKPWTRFLKFFMTKKSFFDSVLDAYKQEPNRRYYGSYQFLRPSLLVRDLDLMRKIMVKDFDYFTDHFTNANEKSDPIMALNLFTLKGSQWKDMRTTLSPAFTSSKMRLMFTLIVETAENVVKYLENQQGTIIEMEMKGLYSRFTTDVIANCAFGIKCDSLKDQDNEFYEMGNEITTFRGWTAFRTLFNVFFPAAFQLLKLTVFPKRVTTFFRKIVTDTISYREANAVIRPDMIHLLMEARKGCLKHEGNEGQETVGYATVQELTEKDGGTSKIQLTDDVVTAQALIFFFAGFDTSSTALSFMSYQLALNPNIQLKLHKEIDENLKKTNGKIVYEEILQMKYLDQVVSEVLRMYPPGYIVNRVCTKEYKIPATSPNENDLVLPKDCLLALPIVGIHRDPKYFPNPDKFDPDRFSDVNKENIVSGSYMPFGSGPRNCIGSRFALLEIKALTVCLLAQFEFIPVENTEIPLQLKKSFNLNAKNGIFLGLKKRVLFNTELFSCNSN